MMREGLLPCAREAILMNVNDFMTKHDITDADIDRMAATYEDGSFEPEPDGKVLSGSHPDAFVSNPLSFAPEEPNAESIEAIHEGDAFLTSG